MARTLYQYRHVCTECTEGTECTENSDYVNYVFTWAENDPGVCPNNAVHTLANTTGTITDKLTEENLVDSQNRLIVAQRSGSPEYTTQWITRGDDVAAVEGPNRNTGNSTLLCTKSTSPGLQVSSVALTDSSEDGGFGAYGLNALQHYVFENQAPLSMYASLYGPDSTWKRKRARIQLMDNVQCKAMWIHWAGGKAGKVFGHAFVFMHNKNISGVLPKGYALRPNGTVGAEFNATLPHNAMTNPVGWVISTYAEEVPLLGSCEKGIDFIAEDSSIELHTGVEVGHLIELWSELTYNADAFTDTDANTCGMFIRLMVYSAKNIDTTWE